MTPYSIFLVCCAVGRALHISTRTKAVKQVKEANFSPSLLENLINQLVEPFQQRRAAKGMPNLPPPNTIGRISSFS